MLTQFRSLHLAPWALLLLLCGCGEGRPTRVPVSGVVLLDGQPLTRGHVRFVPPNDRASSGDIGPDGRFTLSCFEIGDGAVVGQHQVAVIANEPLNETEMRWHAPEKYADHTTSGIVVDISGPTDTVEIKLNQDGSPPAP
jgi:hypothetical protein